jgi:hypothetical protein
VLVDTDHPHPVEAGRVADQYPTSFTQDGIVGGVPRHRQAFGHAGHGEVLTHDRLQRPAQGPPRELRPRLGRPAGVLAPHVPAAGAAVAADRHDQDGGPPTQRLVGEASGHRVAGEALAAAPPTPLVVVDDPAGQHRAIRFQALPGHQQPELIQAAERGQVRAGEGSVRQRGSRVLGDGVQLHCSARLGGRPVAGG